MRPRFDPGLQQKPFSIFFLLSNPLNIFTTNILPYKCQEIVKNTYHNFSEPEVTQRLSIKAAINKVEKVLTFKKLEAASV